MSLVTINWMVQEYIEIHCWSVKRRVAGKRRFAGKRGDDEQCLQAANFRTAKFRRLQIFATYEFSRVAKIFSTWEILRQNFALPGIGTPETTQDQKL